MTPQSDSFAAVRSVGLTLAGVTEAAKYDGSPMLTVGGRFMAGLATHPSAEPATLVVRVTADLRDALLEEAPDTYYLTDHYLPHGVVLARLSRLDRHALGDLLAMSRRLTMARQQTSRASSAGRRG